MVSLSLRQVDLSAVAIAAAHADCANRSGRAHSDPPGETALVGGPAPRFRAYVAAVAVDVRAGWILKPHPHLSPPRCSHCLGVVAAAVGAAVA